MSATTVINGVMDEIERRVATALDILPEQVFEEVDVFTNIGLGAFVNGQIDEIIGMGACNDQAVLTVTVGFAIADNGNDPKRMQRVSATLALRKQLTWGGSSSTAAIPNAALPMVTDMAVSIPSVKARDSVIEGGLTWRASVMLPKGEA